MVVDITLVSHFIDFRCDILPNFYSRNKKEEKKKEIYKKLYRKIEENILTHWYLSRNITNH